MADYPVLDKAGNIVVLAATDTAWTLTPYDNSEDYPVLDGEGAVVVAGDPGASTPAAPNASTGSTISGRTVTISASATGNPTPTFELTVLTLGGVDVLSDVTGTGPWTYAVPSSVSSQTVAWTVAATNSEGTDTADGSRAVAGDLTAPIVTAAGVTGPVDGNLTIDITATGAETGDTVTWSIAPAAGGADVASGTYTWPDSTVALPSGIARGSYVLTVSVGGSAGFASDPFTLSTTAPILSGLSATAGADSIAWAVSTNTEFGSVIAGLRLASAAQGTREQIENATGVYVATITDTTFASLGGTFASLAAGEYTIDAFQEDDFGEVSAIVSASATVAAAGITPTVLGRNFSGNLPSASSSTIALDMSDHDGVEDVVVMLGMLASGGAGGGFGSATLDGVAATTIVTTSTAGSNGPASAYAIFAGRAFSASSNLVVTPSAGAFFGVGAQAYGVPDGATIALLGAAQPQTTRAGSSFVGTLTAGDAVIVGQQIASSSAITSTASTGLTIDWRQDIRASNEWFVAASGGELSAGSFTATVTNSANAEVSAIALRIS